MCVRHHLKKASVCTCAGKRGRGGRGWVAEDYVRALCAGCSGRSHMQCRHHGASLAAEDVVSSASIRRTPFSTQGNATSSTAAIHRGRGTMSLILLACWLTAGWRGADPAGGGGGGRIRRIVYPAAQQPEPSEFPKATEAARIGWRPVPCRPSAGVQSLPLAHRWHHTSTTPHDPPCNGHSDSEDRAVEPIAEAMPRSKRCRVPDRRALAVSVSVFAVVR
jgi:hypothetical protein